MIILTKRLDLCAFFIEQRIDAPIVAVEVTPFP